MKKIDEEYHYGTAEERLEILLAKIDDFNQWLEARYSWHVKRNPDSFCEEECGTILEKFQDEVLFK